MTESTWELVHGRQAPWNETTGLREVQVPDPQLDPAKSHDDS